MVNIVAKELVVFLKPFEGLSDLGQGLKEIKTFGEVHGRCGAFFV